MKININEKYIIELLKKNIIHLEDIEVEDRNVFIEKNAHLLIIESFKDKNFQQLELLFDNKDIQKIFLKEIDSIVKSASINYLEKLPENNIVTEFVWSMSRQDVAIKEQFFRKINHLMLENCELITALFQIRVAESNSSFRKYQPIGLSYLRMIDEDVEKIINQNIVSLDLFSPNTKDTMAHCLYQYSFKTNKIIISKIESEGNLMKFLLDKNDMGQTAIDKLSSDLRTRNIETIEYLFFEKIDIKLFKTECLNYILKCSNIIKNKQTKQLAKQRILSSLERLFNMEEIQNDSQFKEYIAKNLAQKADKEVHYLWLTAKLPIKGKDERKVKI